MNKLAVKNCEICFLCMIVDDTLYKALESDLTSCIQSFQTFRAYTVGMGAAGSEHRLALGIEKWSISRLISEQGRHNIGIAALQSEPASPKGTQEGQERLPSPVLRLQPALQRAPRELGMWKNTGTGLHRGGAHGRNDFREPRLLHPPTHAKALNSSTWDIWF